MAHFVSTAATALGAALFLAGAAPALAQASASEESQGPLADSAAPQVADESSNSIRAVSPSYQPGTGQDVNLLIAGFAETGLAISDRETLSGTTFFSGSLNPGLYVQYKDLLLFESELEIAATEDGDTEVVVEFAQIDLFLHDYATLVVGKFLSPVGQYQERLHPAWINRLPSSPPGFGHDGLQPGADVGVQLRGGVPAGRSRFTYALGIGNGPRSSPHGAPMQEGFTDDDNSNKAISGRIGFLPVPYLEFGASIMRSRTRVAAEEEEGEEEVMAAAASIAEGAAENLPDVDFNIWGLDAAYTRGPWDVRAEFLSGTRSAYGLTMGGETMAVPRLKLRAWYAQVAYRLSGITQQRILQNFEPVVRYGEYRVKGLDELAEEAQETRGDFGLNYWFAPQFVLHGALELRRFTAREEGERKDTRFLFQLGYGF